MLRIYPVCLQLVRDVRSLADEISRTDRDHARQLRRSCMSIAHNLAEGAAVRDGRRRARYGDALGSARETLANLECAEAAGYIRRLDPQVRDRVDHVIGTLVRVLF